MLEILDFGPSSPCNSSLSVQSFFLRTADEKFEYFFSLEKFDIKQALVSCEPSQVFKSFSLPHSEVA